MIDWNMVNNRGMTSLAARLCWEVESDLLTTGLSNNYLLLVNSIGSITKLGNIKALVLNLVLTLNLCDFNSLGDTHFLRCWIGKHARHLKGGSDKGNLVCLCLILFAAHLMFSATIALVTVTITSSSTSSNLHGLRLLFIGNLGGSAGSNNLLLLIHVSTDFSLNSGRCFLADCEDTVKAVVIVNNLLDCKSDRSHLLSKSRHADFSIDGCVGVPAVILRSISICWGMNIGRCNSNKSRDKCELKL